MNLNTTLKYLRKVHFNRDVEENLLQRVISACSHNLTVYTKNSLLIFTYRNNKIIKLNGIKLENYSCHVFLFCHP